MLCPDMVLHRLSHQQVKLGELGWQLIMFGMCYIYLYPIEFIDFHDYLFVFAFSKRCHSIIGSFI